MREGPLGGSGDSRVAAGAPCPPVQVQERLQGQEQGQELDMHLLTDVVWSLCVLQQPQHPLLGHVLGPEFHSRLRGEPGAG